jgi:hypothetical protein
LAPALIGLAQNLCRFTLFDFMNWRAAIHKKHQFRLALCSHKAVETGAVCLALMVQGNLAAITLAHVAIASKTGLIAIAPALALTMTRHAPILANRWASSAIIGLCGFGADVLMHESHYPGAYTEAALTGLATFVLSVVVSYTRVGKAIDHLAEAFVLNERLCPTEDRVEKTSHG